MRRSSGNRLISPGQAVAEKIARRSIVRQTTHPSDSRSNIPTAELESFARPEEKRPATVRYPRDPTLDPQLVWKGKDEQDAHDLQVPAVPIYIQERIDPLALLEELAQRARAGAPSSGSASSAAYWLPGPLAFGMHGYIRRKGADDQRIHGA